MLDPVYMQGFGRTVARLCVLLIVFGAACVGSKEGSSDAGRRDGATVFDGGGDLDATLGQDAGFRDDGGAGEDGGAAGDGGVACFPARRLFFEDFETGDYGRWTSSTYGDGWGNECQSNGFSTDRAVSGVRSHRSEIACAYQESHRGYGGLQFDGDTVVPAYTNTGTGIDAPHGVVNTYWSWLDTPYDFRDGRWFSFWTVNSDCGWGEPVVTLGLENTTWRLTPAHILNTGGTVEFSTDAPSFSMRQWVRTTIYINYHAGEMHIWQDGQSLLHATFSRPSQDICQWHWGAYASGDNDDVVLYEDDISIYKLEAAWTDFSVEPHFQAEIRACGD